MEKKPKTTRKRTRTGQEKEMLLIGRMLRMMIQAGMDRTGKLRVLNFVLDAVTRENLYPNEPLFPAPGTITSGDQQ